MTKTLRRWHLRYSDLHSWLIFAPFYPSGRSRILPRKIRQYYFIDVKTIIFFVIISFSEVSIPATYCINIRGPALGTVKSEEWWPNARAWYRSTCNGRGLWRFCACRIWTPTTRMHALRPGQGREGSNPLQQATGPTSRTNRHISDMGRPPGRPI